MAMMGCKPLMEKRCRVLLIYQIEKRSNIIAQNVMMGGDFTWPPTNDVDI